MLYISPPFGNYFYHQPAISIEGTFTWKRRKGLIYNTIRSLRPVRDGWRNQIGFRNKGIAARLLAPVKANRIVSISAMEPEDWHKLCDYIRYISPQFTSFEIYRWRNTTQQRPCFGMKVAMHLYRLQLHVHELLR